MHYLILVFLAIPSILLIRESWWFKKVIEFLCRMEPDSLYDQSRKHAKLVGVMKWPFLLMLVGLAIPTPWSLDFLLAFVTGFIVGWKDFWRTEPKRLPEPDILVIRKPEQV